MAYKAQSYIIKTVKEDKHRPRHGADQEGKQMKKYEFSEHELTANAFAVYSDSSFTFWVDNNGDFFYSDNPQSEKVNLGTLHDAIDFLESFSVEENNE